MNKKVLTVQDISCFGQCSTTVALPILSACGVETAIMPSAILSTHTGGFSGFTFRDLTEDLPKIMEHWKKEGINFDAIYTGYLGSKRQIEIVIDLFNNLLKEDGIRIVDPAMADNGKLYTGFDEDFVKEMRNLVGTSDIVLPNMTEAALLTDSEILLDNQSGEYIMSIIYKLRDLGAKNIILKGIRNIEGKLGIAVFESDTENIEIFYTERIKKDAHGTGDCYAAAFTGGLMHGKSFREAAKIAAEFVSEAITKTIDDDNHWYGVKFEKALPVLVRELNK